MPTDASSFFPTRDSHVEGVAPERPVGSTLAAMSPRDRLLCAVFLIVLFLASIMPFWNVWSVDLSAYYYAGHFYSTGQLDLIYAGPPEIIGPNMPEPWRAALAADGYGNESTYPYIYLPWVAVVMAPIAATFDVMTVMNAVQIINATLLIASVLLAWRIIGRGRVSLKIWLATSLVLLVSSAASTLALHLGQVQILVFLAVLISVERLQAGKPYQAAAALALAACLKITPAAFGILFLWNREWRGLFAFVGMCLAFAAGSIALIGWPLHATYFEIMGALNAQVFLSNAGVSMEGLLFQIAAFFEGAGLAFSNNEYAFPKPPWQDVVVKLMFCVGLVTCWLVTRRLPGRDRIAFQAFILSVLVPLMTPLGWIHYYLLASVLLPVFFAHGQRVGPVLFLLYLLLLNLAVFVYASLPVLPFMPQMAYGVPLFLGILIWGHVMALREGQNDARLA